MNKPNILDHPAYPKILQLFNDELQKNGKVNISKFYREVVSVEMPGMPARTFSYFVSKHLEPNGSLPALQPVPSELTQIQQTLLSNQQATEQGLQAALNIGSIALRELFNDPVALARMPKEKLADLMFKAMKAQDSRVGAIARMKDDRRAEEKFNRLLNNGIYKKDGTS